MSMREELRHWWRHDAPIWGLVIAAFVVGMILGNRI